MSAEGFAVGTPQAVALNAATGNHAPPAATQGHEIRFHDVLQALNPLQYLPGVGTIYRAVTGDSPPESTRVIGSIIVSGLLGGPIGAAISAVSNFVQTISGVDLDHVAHDALADMGLIDDAAAKPIAAAMPAAIPASPTAAQSATAAEAPQQNQVALADPAPVFTTTLHLRIAVAAYSPDPAPTGQRLGHI